MRSLKIQLLIVLIGIVLTLITFASIYLISSELLESRQETIVLLESEAAADDFDAYFSSVETILNTLSLYIQQEHSDNQLLDYMIKIHEANDNIASIYLGRPDLTMVNSTGFIPPPEFDLTTRIWYQEAIQYDGIIYTNAFVNATQDKLIVTVAKAVYLDDEFIGVVAADIDIVNLGILIGRKEIGESGFAFLIDANQNLLASPSIDYSLIQLNSAVDLNYPILNPNDNPIHYDVTLHEATGVIVVTPVKNGTYSLYVFMDNSEYYQQAVIVRSLMVGIGSVFIAMGSAVLVYYIRYVKKPIDALTSDIDSIQIDESLDYRLSLNPRKGFVGIRRVLNNVLSALSLYQTRLQETHYKLLIENQRVLRLMESNADIVFEIDPNRRFVSVFGKGLKIIKHAPEDFLNKTVIDVFGEDGLERDAHYQEALKGKTVQYEWQFSDDSEQVIYFATIISAIRDEKDNIIGAVGITRNVTEEKLKQKEIEHLSFHDYLTSLYNRRFFSEVLSKYDKPQYYPLTIMSIDVNGLKLINDAFGHQAGDEALKKLANTFKTIINDHGIVCRIGGDEFAVLMPKSNEQIIEEIKEDILNQVAKLKVNNIQLSIALGYVIKTDKESTLQSLMNEAENNMYKQKILEGKSARSNAIQAILQTLKHKYEIEERHSLRVANISKAIGIALKFNQDELKELVLAASVHDIGKIAIPDDVLNKPEPLSPDEYEIIKSHTEAGYQILRAADEYSSLAEDALCHHEHYDGSGYPNQLKGEEIPLFSRIISVADAYEAMTSDRPYRKAMSKTYAIEELLKFRGKQFDPKIVDIFVDTVLKNTQDEL